MLARIAALRRSYHLVAEYDEGPPSGETVSFPSLDWFLCSLLILAGRKEL